MTRILKTSPHQSARESIGTLAAGGRITGITKGQFSLLDLIRAVSDQIGPAALTVSTWSTGIRDTQNLGLLINQGAFTKVSLCLDRSFSGRQPQYVEEVIRVWGAENIRMTRNHAKFFLLRNEAWNICVRSSMNLNRNPRLEQYDLDDSLELCEFFQNVIDEIFQKMPAGLTRKTPVCNRVFAGILGGGLSDAYLLKDLEEIVIDLEGIDFKF
ncbi:MAG: hypothetical protein ABIJ57_12305 [Pseudomonadota bacterium]